MMRGLAVTVSELRQNIYQLLDQVLDSGVPLEIERKGRKLRITPEPPHDKLDNLKRRDCLTGDPEAIVHMDWSQEWRP
jgi:antitoxin (DNA-binding transcriptional repressor) of toxin-antitoxin stability system